MKVPIFNRFVPSCVFDPGGCDPPNVYAVITELALEIFFKAEPKFQPASVRQPNRSGMEYPSVIEQLQNYQADISPLYMTLNVWRSDRLPHLGPILPFRYVFLYRTLSEQRTDADFRAIFPLKAFVLLIVVSCVLNVIHVLVGTKGGTIPLVLKYLSRSSLVIGIFAQLFWSYFSGTIILLFNKPPVQTEPFTNLNEFMGRLETGSYTAITTSNTIMREFLNSIQ